MTEPENSSSRPWEDENAKPFIRIMQLSKHFGEVRAVDNVDLDIFQGELFSIVGGSGSGKTTLLRMLAGFETPTQGRILIDDVDITDMPAYERPVNMMFQSYALFPHMTVAKNIGYGLKRDGLPKKAIDQRVRDILDLVQMGELAKRKPSQLSGGQRQRVALARALVKRPKVLLLDEPLGALDKKLREETQFELVNIQEETGITFVVVTHDQEEAMTLSTRIAVMNEGKFPQVGTPTEIYEYPNSRFTADFIGTINIFAGVVLNAHEQEMSVSVKSLDTELRIARLEGIEKGDRVFLAVRPEKIHISHDSPGKGDRVSLAGTVLDQGYFGNLSIYRVQLETGEVLQVSAQNRIRKPTRSIDWDESVFVHWDYQSMVVLKE
jgi:putrescine transport system ATP-binding protein